MLKAHQIDARILRLAARNVPAEEICAKLLLPWQRVAAVLKAQQAPAPQEYVPPAASDPGEADALDEAIALLRAKHHQVVRLPDGTFLLNDRERTAEEVIARAQRIVSRLWREVASDVA